MNLIKEYHDLEICNDCLYYNEFGNLGGLHEQCNLNAVSPCTTGNICEACVAVRTGFIELKKNSEPMISPVIKMIHFLIATM